MPSVAVVDTNVVVSGLLTGDSDAPTRRILDAMLLGRFPFLLSIELLAEMRAVLLRPRIRVRHGLTHAEVDQILQAIAANGVIREPRYSGAAAPDPGDNHLWALLRVRPGSVLVTGDGALLEARPDWAEVMTPAVFVTLLEQQAGASRGGS